MSVLDVFRGDAFTVVSLTDAINKPLVVPQRIASMGIFTETSVTTVDIAIEERDGLLVLVPPNPRGGPGITLPKPPRQVRVLRAPHHEINDAIMAEEVQGVRAWGSESEVEMVMDRVADRLVIHRNSHEATIEYSRAGALKGVVKYADGTELDLFKEFDVTQEPVVDFDLANPNPAAGVLRAKCAQIQRTMSRNLGAIGITGARALTGRAFFDALLAHKEVRETYLNTPAAAQLRDPYIRTQEGMIVASFSFGGIVWEDYELYVGGTEFVQADEAHFFPTGVPNLFKTYMAPADYIETVNRPGQRLYVKQYEMPNDKGVHFDTQANLLHVCTRPKALMTGTM
jgi:hypothetical protein